jgi:hypothetical protein
MLRFRPISAWFGIATAGVAMVAFAVDTASAQGLFNFFFGHGYRRMAPPENDPRGNFDAPGIEEPAGPVMIYCVRLCDGHYFPINYRSSITPAEMCKAFCPAARTKVFTGSGIDRARATDGQRYADLDTAFNYRDKLADNCTCDGKSPGGVARIAVTQDPTLRSGDIIATKDGIVAAKEVGRGLVRFTPVDRAKVTNDMRRHLSRMRVNAPVAGDAPQMRETTGEAARPFPRPGQSAR